MVGTISLQGMLKRENLEIAPFTTIAARGGVTKTITEPKKSWAGFPLMGHREWLKLQGRIAKLLK